MTQETPQTDIKLLIIEDDDDDFIFLKRMLKNKPESKFQYHLTHAHKLDIGLKHLEPAYPDFDVILLDLSLPESQGMATFQKVHQVCQSIPVIILTGLDSDEMAMEIVRKGAQDYLVKNDLTRWNLLKVILYAIERKKLETEKLKLQHELLQVKKLESIGKLAGGIAHEFNNLLAGILGNASLIKNKLTDEKIIRQLETIEKSSQHGADLTQQLLGFSRQGILEKKKTNLKNLIKQTSSLLMRTFSNQVTIEVEVSDDLSPIYGDSIQIQQALTQIGFNAKEASQDEDNPLIKIKASNLKVDQMNQNQSQPEPGDYVLISISDNGKGIDPAIKDKIFDPFFSTKSIGEGAGLGLSMAYGIIQNHGGVLNYTTSSQGTTFYIFLPSMESEKTTPKDLEQLAQDNSSNLQTILIVDDEEILRDLLRDSLETMSPNLLTATNGKEALRLFEQQQDKIDLVVMDILMPEMNGVDAYKKMAEINPSLKVLFVSGYSENQEIEDLKKSEHVDFLQKPFMPQDLLKKTQDLS